jgi:catechol 2,3-dioxygenase-like lactoylglutathione lyase family enzyme
VSDSWLSDTGIRVTNMDRSVRFYTALLDLVELTRSQGDDWAYVLFKDRRSGQRLELNWYSERSPFYTPFVAGEGLDHLEVRVRELSTFLTKLKGMGIVPVNRSLWVNPAAVEAMKSRPEDAAELDQEVWVTSSGHHIAYVEDPDGNLLCLYDHPEEDFDAPIPEHY